MKTNTSPARPLSQKFFRHLCGGVLLALSLLLGQFSSRAALLIDDPFNYTVGNLNGQGTWSSSGSVPDIQVAAGNLSVAGLVASSGNKISYTGTGRNSYKTFSGPASGTIYFSFILRPTVAPAAASLFASLNSSSTTKRECIHLGADGRLGLSHNAGTVTYGGSALTVGTDYLVVGSLEIVAGSANDIYRLWINPPATTFESNAPPAHDVQMTSTGDTTFTTARFYFQRDVNIAGVDADELRVGVSWAEVTPLGGPLVGAKLGFTTQPAGAAPSATMSPVVVQVQTAGGAAVPSNGVPVTLTLSAGSGTLSGTLTQNTDGTGKATFNNLSIDTAGTGKQLTAAASGIGAGLTAAVSSTFTIADPSTATQLAFTSQPTDTQVSTVMSSVVVQVQDGSSVAVATNGVPVTLTLSAGTGTLAGTLTQNTDATGKATFNNLSINAVGNGKQLTATAAGLTDATSSAFNITTGGGGGGSPGLNVSQTRMLSAGYEVAGTNGIPTTFAQIVGSPSLTLPQSNWLLVAYGNLDGSGNIIFTNPVSPAMPLAFYRLRTGNNVTKLEPPSILAPPQSQIVSPGATATFTVGAAGPLLQYLWLFNGAPIKNATNSTLVIPNAQAINAGNYQVIVANPGGSATSPIATLGVGNVGPTITSHPADQSVSAGGSAPFNVTATGTSPLTYQWYYNTNTSLPDATNALLTLTGVTTNSAGKYSCTVANAFGSAGSSNANLSISPVPTGIPETNVLGWAAYAGVTGGEFGGATASIICSNYASFSNAVRQAAPLTIYVHGTITNTENYCYIYGHNKSIIGLGTNAAFIGDLRANATNIIIRNLFFTGTLGNSDLITIDNNAKFVWVDHCTFYDAPDGSIDITKGADYITVSWCKFTYSYAPPGNTSHEFVNLIGSSDTDTNVNFHVTFHHNWWGDGCRERMPSVRAGHVHVFNNYYDCIYNNYCIRTRLHAEVLVENNYFLNVQNPWERFTTSTPGAPGLLKATGNITNNCTWSSTWVGGVTLIPGNDTLGGDLSPPLYPYTLDPAADVPYYIQTYSGHGKYPFGP